MELIFRATRDGSNSESFHKKCDDQGPTITLIKSGTGYIFGGYSSISWSSKNERLNAPNSFLFTLTNCYNIKPTQFLSTNDQKEVYHNSDYGPSFGNGTDLGINSEFINSGGWSNFPETYIDTTGKGKTLFTDNFDTRTNAKFEIKELEVFKVFK